MASLNHERRCLEHDRWRDSIWVVDFSWGAVASRYSEKRKKMKNMLITVKKGSWSLDEYLRAFKSICDNLFAIKSPISDQDKVFQFAHGLGPRYENFRIVMLTKSPYPSYSQFLLALQGYEQSFTAQKEEEKTFLEHAQAYFGNCSHGRNGLGGIG